ncbi:MAG: hypothetical protein FWG20_04615 [Candidatus Cloacimonetes bacterium]|nr:hypothetical protein [Candidatus Cloacimonadota bacterium]
MQKYFLLLLLICFSFGLLVAQGSVFEHVNVIISIPSVSYLTVSQHQVELDLQGYPININQEYRPYIEQDITYNILTAGTNKRLVAQLANGPMAPGTILEVRANPPQNATSLGFVALTTGQQPLVTNISNVQGNNLEMRFRLRAELGAPIVSRETKTVRLTIME